MTPRRAVTFAACVWAVLFAAPHVWWARGFPMGFPGGRTSHQLMMNNAWRYTFDVVVIVCCGRGAHRGHAAAARALSAAPLDSDDAGVGGVWHAHGARGRRDDRRLDVGSHSVAHVSRRRIVTRRRGMAGANGSLTGGDAR